MKFVPARWFHTGRLKEARLIVVHCTVSPEMGTGAEAVANYFKTGSRRASTHRVSDDNSTVQCVLDQDTAFGAAGANSDGLHLELVGYPNQTQAQWLDPFSLAMLHESGKTMREWASEFDIPHRWLSVAEVMDGITRGFCTHHDVSRAFPDVSTGHYDPGVYFPKSTAMTIWFPQPPAPTKDDDAMFTYEYRLQSGDVRLVQVAGGKQVSLTGNDLLVERRKHPESHLIVSDDEVTRYETAFGPIIK